MLFTLFCVYQFDVLGERDIDVPQVLIEHDTPHKTIHVFVALCDNEHQGIVPVPSHMGNGNDLKGNLYWGSAYGIRTFFKRSSDWTHIKDIQIDDTILQRSVFQHIGGKYFLIADAYDGSK